MNTNHHRYHFLNTPRTLSWSTWEEFLVVAKIIQDIQLPNYTDLFMNTSFVLPVRMDMRINNYATVLTLLQQWESRGKVPFAITSTSLILEIWYSLYSTVVVMVSSQSSGSSNSSNLTNTLHSVPKLSNDYTIRLSASLVITRFINTLVDSHQTKQYAQSINDILVRNYSLPRWLVDIRHDISHNSQLPTINVLYNACHYLFLFLRDNFWQQQIELIQLLYIPVHFREPRRLYPPPEKHSLLPTISSSVSPSSVPVIPILRIGEKGIPQSKLHRYIHQTRVRFSKDFLKNNPFLSFVVKDTDNNNNNNNNTLTKFSNSRSTDNDKSNKQHGFHHDLSTILQHMNFHRSTTDTDDEDDVYYLQKLVQHLHGLYPSSRHRKQVLKSFILDTLMKPVVSSTASATDTSSNVNSTIQQVSSLMKILVPFHLVWKDTTVQLLSILNEFFSHFSLFDTLDKSSSTSSTSVFSILVHLFTSQYWYSYVSNLPSLDVPTVHRSVPLPIPNLDVLHSLPSWNSIQRRYLALPLPISLYFGLYRRTNDFRKLYNRNNNLPIVNSNGGGSSLDDDDDDRNNNRKNNDCITILEDYCIIDELISLYDIVQQIQCTYPKNRLGLTTVLNRMDETELHYLVPKPWTLQPTEAFPTENTLVSSTAGSSLADELSLEDMEALLASPSSSVKAMESFSTPTTSTVVDAHQHRTNPVDYYASVSSTSTPDPIILSYRPSRVPRWRI